MKKIFFDHASTTKVDQRVLDEMLPYFTEIYGNPSSHIHEFGNMAMKGLEGARERVAGLINCKPDEIIFTSGATESNNLALKGISFAYKDKGKHIIVSEVEHYSILSPLLTLRRNGFDVTYIEVDDDGLVNPDDVKKAITKDTILISIMHANSEIGTIEPIEEIGNIARENDIIFHTDAASTGGILSIDVNSMNIDLLTLSAHNIYGPKGVGALYLRNGIKLIPLLEGGFQESGYRSGTENLPGIIGFGSACKLAKEEMELRRNHLISLREKLWKGLEEKIDFIHFTGHRERRLPGHVSFWIEHLEGESLLLLLSLNGIMAASGSACSSNLKGRDERDLQASHVLRAIGVPSDICSGSITITMGKDNKEEEVDYLLEIMPGIVERLWKLSPSYSDMLKKRKEEL